MKRTLFKNACICLSLILMVSCELNDDENLNEPEYPVPTISIGDNTSANLGVGQFLNFNDIDYEAAVALSRFTILDGDTPLFSRIFNDGTVASVDNESFLFQIPEAWFNTTRSINFEVTDELNQSARTTFTLTVSDIVPQYSITTVTINGEEFRRIEGIVNFDEILSASHKYLLNGVVEVSQQTTLTIEPGTHIYGETTESRLEVNEFATLLADGTLENPIVFSAFSQAPGQTPNDSAGQWSGIGIRGSGGNSSSGIIKYLRLEYPGSDDDAIQLTNVGNGTTAEYLQVYRSPDNAFRINEGTVNLKYIIATDCEDAGIRYDDAWNGAGQFWVINTTFTTGNAVEGRDDALAVLSNITITGIGVNVPGEASNGGGFRIRNGAKANIYNTVVTGVDRSLRFSNGSELFTESGESFMSNSISFGNDEDDGTGFHSTADFFNPTDNDYLPQYNNSVSPITITDSYVGTDTANSTAAGVINPFFTDVNYVGAVEAGNDWTLGWCLNIDGSLRN